MFEHGPDDTIAAVATPPGPGGIGLLRLSGPRAAAIAGRVFQPKRPRPGGFPDHRAVLGEIRGRSGKEPLDEGFLTYFRAPRSYTRQDVVEISCHGSPAVLEEALRRCVRAGARLAEPGEFTFRAFLNGRLDLLQAEAVDTLIRSFTLPQVKAAVRQVRGALTGRIAALRDGLVELLGDVEAGLEFPEDGIPVRPEGIINSLRGISASVERLIDSYWAGRTLREGLTLALAGRANVGKSTLFNALLDEPRAIVSAEAGTTRDFLRERLVVGGSVFHLVDMAGLEKGRSEAEREGIRRGRSEAEAADGILFVFDLSRPVSRADESLARSFPGKKAVFVLNKSDRPRRFDVKAVRAQRPGTPIIEVSALSGRGIPALRTLIRGAFPIPSAAGADPLLHLRQKLVLEELRDALAKALRAAEEGRGGEITAEELRPALDAVGRLTGRISTDEVIAGVFGRFCLGK